LNSLVKYGDPQELIIFGRSISIRTDLNIKEQYRENNAGKKLGKIMKKIYVVE
jgi:hypothetical protein